AAAPCRSPKRWRRIRRDRILSSRDDAALKAVADHPLRQFAADEDDAALAPLAVLPFALVIALQHHVHALEDVAVVIVAEGEDALRAQDLLAFAGDELLQPRHEFRRIERLVRTQRQRLHFLVVVMLQPAMAMAVIVVVIVMAVLMMVVVVIVTIGFEKRRLDFE